ncbi:MAG: GFA family protein [Burkholderiaceae bacterium]
MTATCACGQASITVDALPSMHGVCHCTNCKRRTGSAFGISAYFDRTAVVQQRGETKTYTFHHTAQNHDQERHFCSHCGTTLFSFVSSVPEKIGIAGGCFADGGLPEPSYSVTDRKRESWVSLPQHWEVYAD